VYEQQAHAADDKLKTGGNGERAGLGLEGGGGRQPLLSVRWMNPVPYLAAPAHTPRYHSVGTAFEANWLVIGISFWPASTHAHKARCKPAFLLRFVRVCSMSPPQTGKRNEHI
jgi:hypothetical protein